MRFINLVSRLNFGKVEKAIKSQQMKYPNLTPADEFSISEKLVYKAVNGPEWTDIILDINL